MRKTKIICTLGPASDTEEVIKELILAGMDVARINFSHGEYSEHKHKADTVKKLRAELGVHTALLLDTKGPEIRLKTFENGKAVLAGRGTLLTLYGRPPRQRKGRFYHLYRTLAGTFHAEAEYLSMTDLSS